MRAGVTRGIRISNENQESLDEPEENHKTHDKKSVWLSAAQWDGAACVFTNIHYLQKPFNLET